MSDEKIQLIPNKCCICETTKHSVYFKDVDQYVLLKCKKCSLVYLKEYPNTLFNFIDDSLENEKIEYWSIPNLYKKHQNVFDNFFGQRLKRVKQFHQNSLTNVLDIGIGFGFWADYLKERGANVYGIDVSTKAIEYCKENQIECDLVSFENFISEQQFSLICMFDVLEHFEDPRKMLTKLRSNMNKESLLYIQVPNVLGIRIPFGHSLGLPYHLWQFNPKTLYSLLESSGFEVLNYWTGIQGVIGHYEKGGPSKINKALWKLANFFKIGNRIQVMVRIKNE